MHFPNPTTLPNVSVTTSQSSPPTVAEPTPPTTVPAQPAPIPVIDLTDELNEPDPVYPRVSELLAELDESMPALGFVQYEGQLLAAGFGYVHQLVDTPIVRAVLDSLVPVGVAEEILNRAQRMTRRAEKSKCAVKHESDLDYKD